MTEESGIFPNQSEIIERGIVALSRRLECNYNLIQACLGNLDLGWETPEHLKKVRETTEHFNRAAVLAQQLHKEMTRMTPGQLKDLEITGAVTMYQIEHLSDVLSCDSKSLKEWSRTKFRKGAKNTAAYNVAELVRRLFRRCRKSITYGADQYGFPSTEFGRTVEFALSEFGIRASWRGPTREAVDKHLAHGRRLAACAIRAARARRPQPPNTN